MIATTRQLASVISVVLPLLASTGCLPIAVWLSSNVGGASSNVRGALARQTPPSVQIRSHALRLRPPPQST